MRLKIKESVPDFCKRMDLELEDLMCTFAHLLRIMNIYIDDRELSGKVIVNKKVLKEAVVNFYVDIARIKVLHGIKEPSIEKDNAYKAYWLLRRKALQVIGHFDDCEFINEHFVTVYLLSVLSRQKNINDDMKKKNQSWSNFSTLLYRNMQYRPLSQQSLELMITSLFCGYDFSAIITNPAEPSMM